MPNDPAAAGSHEAPTVPPCSSADNATRGLATPASAAVDARAPAGYMIERELGRGGVPRRLAGLME